MTNSLSFCQKYNIVEVRLSLVMGQGPGRVGPAIYFLCSDQKNLIGLGQKWVGLLFTADQKKSSVWPNLITILKRFHF